jgi:ubiquinone/menaquinone biosynthesis C-methylase UbiE
MAIGNEFFDHRAKDWEAHNYPPDVRRRLEELITAFGIRECERVLDIGTGPGILIPYLREWVGEEGRICALDLSFEMVRTARMKVCRETDLVLRADVHHLPLKSDSQDRVICFAAFPHFADPRSALMEMSRVLTLGGVLVIAHLMSRRELASHHGTHSAVARDVLPGPGKMRALFADAGLAASDIIDEPGRYLAVGLKQIDREPGGRFR